MQKLDSPDKQASATPETNDRRATLDAIADPDTATTSHEPGVEEGYAMSERLTVMSGRLTRAHMYGYRHGASEVPLMSLYQDECLRVAYKEGYRRGADDVLAERADATVRYRVPS